MRALTVDPSQPGSARLESVSEPAVESGSVLVQTLLIGICGTDREIVQGKYGSPPPGRSRLILGHESLGRVVDAPAESGFTPGELVAAIVRRPDPIPCTACAVGEWDMCRNGLYTECGIKERDGFAAERFRIDPQYLVSLDPSLSRVGVLLEPASILAKAWDHIARIGGRSEWSPRRVLVTGAGPIGLLAAMMAVQRGYETRVLDRVAEGPKPGLVRDLGATYFSSSIKEAGKEVDIVIECTGVGQLVFDAMQITAPGGIACLTGISSGGRVLEVDAGTFNRGIVLENDVVFGSVNANRRHYDLAAAALAQADKTWLDRLITRRVPLAEWHSALAPQPHDVKVVLEFDQANS